MIKRIKGSLFAKVFILTVAVLLCVSFLVYGVLAWYMPQTYSNNLNAALDEQTSDFIYELEHIRMQDSGGLFDQFLQNTTISMVELYTADGVLVETPSNQNSFNDGITGEALGGASYESAPIISNSYYFSFADDNSQYILTVYGEASQIAELRQSFVSVLPILFCVILLVSLATAWVYSRIITNPVLKISRISKEMSDMRLEWQLEERRSDELGVLENSLNTLSRKLSATLEELQSANLQLQKDIEHQKALERAQQDFFSSASHELKTPITIIKGQLEGMLLGIGAYKDHEKYLARSLEVAATLETMVQEILTISRLETNVDFKMEHFDCAPMIHGYLREIDDLVATKELQIHLAIQSPAFINGNKLLIEKVFSNLISNAVKYSPHGASVDIILQNTNGRFLFSVENTGTHIPEDDIPKLFDAFYRMEQSRSRRTGGSGLGLYMVQRILQQHNSYCEACNTENGVKFFFTIYYASNLSLFLGDGLNNLPLFLTTHKSQTNPKGIPKCFAILGVHSKKGLVNTMRRMALCAASMLLLGCLAGCSTTPQNSQEQGNPVIKEEISQPLGGSEALGNSEDSSALSAADKEKMFAPYEQYGMTYDAVKDELTYNGNLVRWFEDYYPISNNETAGIDFLNENGTVDVYAVRDLESFSSG